MCVCAFRHPCVDVDPLEGLSRTHCPTWVCAGCNSSPQTSPQVFLLHEIVMFESNSTSFILHLRLDVDKVRGPQRDLVRKFQTMPHVGTEIASLLSAYVDFAVFPGDGNVLVEFFPARCVSTVKLPRTLAILVDGGLHAFILRMWHLTDYSIFVLRGVGVWHVPQCTRPPTVQRSCASGPGQR